MALKTGKKSLIGFALKGKGMLNPLACCACRTFVRMKIFRIEMQAIHV